MLNRTVWCDIYLSVILTTCRRHCHCRRSKRTRRRSTYGSRSATSRRRGKRRTSTEGPASRAAGGGQRQHGGGGEGRGGGGTRQECVVWVGRDRREVGGGESPDRCSGAWPRARGLAVLQRLFFRLFAQRRVSMPRSLLLP